MTRPDTASDPFLGEILAQPDALRASAAGLAGQQDKLRKLHDLARRSSGLVLTGMGSSHDACLSTASALGRYRTMATTVNTAELLHFRMDALDESVTVVAVSQSGSSVELVRVARALLDRECRPALVSITNGLSNPLAELADIALDTTAGHELGPSTKTFAACLVVLRAVAEALGQPGRLRTAELCAHIVADSALAATAAERLLDDPAPRARTLCGWCAERRSLVVLGRGTARAAAEMGALILKEAAKRHAESLDTAEFRHGPLELAGPDLAVVLISTERATLELDLRLADELAADGAATLLITSSGQPSRDRIVLGDLQPMLAAAVAVIPLQLLAWQLAVDGGHDPGQFTRASKVTMRE
jgi:glucosamine--fructose-6-phosphate aminotransferase (isomerizing)